MVRPWCVLALLLAAAAVQGVEQEVQWAPGMNYAPLETTEGDTVKLTWTGMHGVWKLPSMECPEQWMENEQYTELVAPKDGGEWTWTCGDDTKGDNYVACPVDRHCEMGQVIEISCNY